jgi:hypothetical protein
MVYTRARLNSSDLEHNAILTYKFKLKQNKNLVRRSEQILKLSHKESNNLDNFIKYCREYKELSEKHSNTNEKNNPNESVNLKNDSLRYTLHINCNY